MTRHDVVRRVEADLRRGHTHLALQRLATLGATYPDDLTIRARRAEVYRRVGNWVEAGRWGFLTEDVTEAEIAAFERAHPHPWPRLRALKLTSDVSGAVGPIARQRLADLVDAATVAGPAPVTWTDAGPVPQESASLGDELPCLLAALVVLVVLGLAVVGVVTLVRLAVS